MFPRFTPGQTVIADGDCFVIAHTHIDGSTWIYWDNVDINIASRYEEDDIEFVLNGGYWVPAENWNSPTVAEYTKEMLAGERIFQEMTAEDPEEKEWLEKKRKEKA